MSKVELISAEKLAKEISNKKNIKLIDIRSEGEFRHEHIDGAINVSVDKLAEIETTADDSLVFNCMSGLRTKQCEDIFKNLEAKHIYILEGGLIAWKKASFATKKDKKAPLPIMRQVQIVAGSIILLFVILSFAYSKYFAIVSGFMGAGLLFAGLTGTCGLASVFMLLPYNRNHKSYKK